MTVVIGTNPIGPTRETLEQTAGALADLGHLAGRPEHRGGTPDLFWAEYRHIITEHIGQLERTLQTRIGPSELGIACPRCLAHKLAGHPERRGEDWLPFVGTAVHAQLQDIFTGFNAQYSSAPPRFLTELTVDVGEVAGVTITGHLDLYDTVEASVTDWKVVGVSTMRAVKANGLPAAYHAQGHLYGRGAIRRGLPVERVRVAFLPRNDVTLSGSLVIDEPYDERVALDTLARASAVTALAATMGGWDALIPTLPTADGCFSCSRYPLPDGSYPPKPGRAAYDPFADLL